MVKFDFPRILAFIFHEYLGRCLSPFPIDHQIYLSLRYGWQSIEEIVEVLIYKQAGLDVFKEVAIFVNVFLFFSYQNSCRSRKNLSS